MSRKQPIPPPKGRKKPKPPPAPPRPPNNKHPIGDMIDFYIDVVKGVRDAFVKCQPAETDVLIFSRILETVIELEEKYGYPGLTAEQLADIKKMAETLKAGLEK